MPSGNVCHIFFYMLQEVTNLLYMLDNSVIFVAINSS